MINQLSNELRIPDLSEGRRSQLEEAKEEFLKERNAIADMIPWELGQLHTLFFAVRALFKKNGDAALSGLADRVGLGHILEKVRECKSGFLKRTLEFLALINL